MTTASIQPLKFTLGPVQYYWTKQQMQLFYQEAAASKADVVYLGETVCAKRRELKFSDYMDIALMLREAGKEVVLSTMTLLESPPSFVNFVATVTMASL